MIHSPLGPSASERWLQCPGSVLLTKDLPDHSSEYAIEGTAAHTLSDWCYKEDAPAATYKGRTIPVKTEDGEVDVIVDYEMINAVQVFLDYIYQFDGDHFHEVQVHYDSWVPDGFGTSDHITIMDRLCRTTDYKHGKGIKVYAEGNTQTMLYALGAYQEYRHLYEFDKFIMAIVQPRLDHIDEVEVTLEELLEWAESEVRPAGEAALQADAPLKAGSWCRWCKVRNTCKTRIEYNLSKVHDDFTDLDAVKPGSLLDPKTITNDELSELLFIVPELKKLCSDIEAKAHAELSSGYAVGDWKLVAGRRSRHWTSEGDAEKALRSTKLKVKEFLPPKLVSPAQAEKLLERPVFEKFLSDVVVWKQGKPVMAPGDDPRDPYELDAEEEFSDC